MRRLVAVFILLIGAIPAQATETFDDPEALVEAIYDSYKPGAKPEIPESYYSSRLLVLMADQRETAQAALFAPVSDEAALAGEPVDPFVSDRNVLIANLAIGEPVILGDRAMVSVSYHNFDQPRLLAVALIREGAGWVVDDVASMGADEHWLLSWALTYDVFSM
ncbi:hypothetical protein [Devosia nitrariae]|uniref:DUF3828 domain-containing protein n=1 Tax=Devosia nitrariae TaxID=2071872 RepID=A0ABQ5W171_9HYPH|nr:hypothetical protein [Devosia nitrariae]GLQ53468.1 hypothetical protein GCM10010862_07270 [Devosia nitrariae]